MTNRTPEHPIDPLFLERWSPRAFDGSDMPEDDLLDDVRGGALGAVGVQLAALALPLRAARRRELGALPRPAHPVEPELGAQRLGADLHPVRQPADDRQGRASRQPSHTHSYDAGAAWACLALQATRMGYQAHGMSGVDFDRRAGRAGRARALSASRRRRWSAGSATPRRCREKLRARETPSGRKPVEEFAFAGQLPGLSRRACARRGFWSTFAARRSGDDGRSSVGASAGARLVTLPARPEPIRVAADETAVDRHRHAERLCLARRLSRPRRLRHWRRRPA